VRGGAASRCRESELKSLASVPEKKAEAYFDRSLANRRQQEAKSWELSSAMSMARLWRNQAKRDESRELLAPVYGWFTEGFDTRDLKEAKASSTNLRPERDSLGPRRSAQLFAASNSCLLCGRPSFEAVVSHPAPRR